MKSAEVVPFDVYSVTSYSACQAIMVCRSLQTCAFPFFAASYCYNMDRVVLSQCCDLPVKAYGAVYNFMSILLIYCPLKL